MVVKLDIGLWQTGMVFDVGEKLVFKVSGHCMTLAEFPQLRGAELQANRGTHIVHMGGPHKSHISIPLVTL
jgi:predicted acyl esterase